jgi:hypothetical protein
LVNTFQLTVDIKSLESKNPEVARNGQLLDELGIFYRGGKELKDNAARWLTKRTREIGTEFQTRLSKVHADNILATAVSYYESRLFENDLDIEFTTKESTSVDDFYAAFLQNCDRGSTTLLEFFGKVATDVLVFGRSWYLIDLPKLAVTPTNLYEQKAAGGLDPYLCYLPVGSVTNWALDANGNFDWVMVHTINDVQRFLLPGLTRETWTYYDKQQYAKYQTEYETGKAKPTTANLIDSGSHSMSAFNEVPVECVSADDKLWLGNRIFSGLVEHLNSQCGLSWSLFLSNFPVPVLTDGPNATVAETQTVSEYSFLKMPNGSAFAYVEPAGNGWTASLEYLETLKESLFRQCHLIAMARSSRATPSAQSSASKQQDWNVSASILNGFGTKIRNQIQDTLDDIAQIRGDDVQSDCRGLNFTDDGAASTVELVLEAKSLNIPSDTFNKELNKKVVRAVLRDANDSLLQTIIDEINAAPAQTQITPTQDTVALNISERGQI